jgi:DNA-binding transcriptional regulator YiaG
MATHVKKAKATRTKIASRTTASGAGNGRSGTIAGKRPRRSPVKSGWAAALQKMRANYEIDSATQARMLGITQTTLASWESSGKVGESSRRKIKIVSDQLKQLSELIPKNRFAQWLTTPNQACAAAGGKTPLDLMEKGRYDKIDQFICLMGSGVAY